MFFTWMQKGKQYSDMRQRCCCCQRLCLYTYISKVFEKLKNNGLVACWLSFFLISNMLSNLLVQLHIFWQLYFIELFRTFNRSEATQTVLLDISKALTGFGKLVSLTNSSLTKFQVECLASFCLFSVIDDFE